MDVPHTCSWSNWAPLGFTFVSLSGEPASSTSTHARPRSGRASNGELMLSHTRAHMHPHTPAPHVKHRVQRGILVCLGCRDKHATCHVAQTSTSHGSGSFRPGSRLAFPTVARAHFLLVGASPHCVPRCRGRTRHLFYNRGLVPPRGLASRPCHLPKAVLPNIIALGSEFRADTSIQVITHALKKLHRLRSKNLREHQKM